MKNKNKEVYFNNVSLIKKNYCSLLTDIIHSFFTTDR